MTFTQCERFTTSGFILTSLPRSRSPLDEAPLWHVRHDADGDEEDLERHELDAAVAAHAAAEGTRGAAAEGAGAALLAWGLAATYLAAQLVCCFTFREIRVSGDRGGMPFSCMQMFTMANNIFGDDMISWYSMMSGPPAQGTFEAHGHGGTPTV